MRVPGALGVSPVRFAFKGHVHGKLPFTFGSQDYKYDGDLCKISRHVCGQVASYHRRM